MKKLYTSLLLSSFSFLAIAQVHEFKVHSQFRAIPYQEDRPITYQKKDEVKFHPSKVKSVRLLETKEVLIGKQKVEIAVIQLTTEQGADEKKYWVSKDWLVKAGLTDVAITANSLGTVIAEATSGPLPSTCRDCEAQLEAEKDLVPQVTLTPQVPPAPVAVATVKNVLDCDLSALTVTPPIRPKVWGIEGQAPKSGAAAASKVLLTELLNKKNGNSSCESIETAVKAAFSNAQAYTWDDFVLLSYLRGNLSELMANPSKLLALGHAAEISAGSRPGDHDGFVSSSLMKSFGAFNDFNIDVQAIDIRNTINQLSMEEFRARGMPEGYEGVAKLGPDAVSEAAGAISKKFSELYNPGLGQRIAPLVAAKSLEFARHCDGKLSKIFGNAEKTKVGGSGFDFDRNKTTKTIGDYGQSRRPHLCTAMHVYSDVESHDSPQMFYLPAKCSTGGTGTGKRCRSGDPQDTHDEKGNCIEFSESFPSTCSALGRFKNVKIMTAHISIQGRTVPKIKNDAGSTSVGFLAGSGGESTDGYAHSHVQVSGGGFRLHFSDAFCRSDKY
ncbi:MAG TPA: hypothetical protein VNJ01_01330 [Bacteriovoracaceae bacterium]|nr:hypothetical protein [Bacteriovoracaceae bacterium]